MTDGNWKDSGDAKQAVRRAMRARLLAMEMPPEAIGQSLAAHFFAAGYFASAPLLAGFLPVRQEPDIMPILRRWLEDGRRLVLPAFDAASRQYALAPIGALDDSCLAEGRYGIPEPRPEILKLHLPFAFDPSTVWLIPGLAFTPAGIRLGRGGGYYDRLLEGAPGIRVGVLHSCQLVDTLPEQGHDVRMDYLLTETGIIHCS